MNRSIACLAIVGIMLASVQAAESAKVRFPRGDFGIALGDSITAVDKAADRMKFVADEGTNVSLPKDSWRHFTLPSGKKYKWLTVTLRENKVEDITLVYDPGAAHPSFQEVLEELRARFGRPRGVSDKQYEAPLEDGAGGDSGYTSRNHNQSAYWFDGHTLVGLHVRRSKIQGLNPIGPEPRELFLKIQNVPPGTTLKVHLGRGRTLELTADAPAPPR